MYSFRSYVASMASLHCSFSNARKGIEVHIRCEISQIWLCVAFQKTNHCLTTLSIWQINSGYNHKLSILLKRIVEAMNEIETKVTEELFNRIKDKVSWIVAIYGRISLRYTIAKSRG